MPRRVVVTAVLLLLLAADAVAQSDPLVCGQQPGSRYFWTERAFCDLPSHGPAQANGAIIWNHGMSGTTHSWSYPAPPAFRLLQARGWDVIMLKRHHGAENDRALYRTVQRTLQEVTALKKAGYRKVVLAGQSFGGYVTLEAADSSPDIDGAIALAPGVRSASAAGSLDPSITDRLLQTVKVGRLALVFPKHDALFNYLVRGENAQAILSRRSLPFLLIDETSGISGHGGAVTGRFAVRYGPCLAEFLAAPTLPAGRFACPTAGGDDWAIVRELLLPPASERPTFVRDATAFPAPVGALLGPRWTLLGDSAVLVAPVDGGGGQLRLMYRSTGYAGGIVDAAIKDGGIRATLPNGATVILKPDGDGVLKWSASDNPRSVDGPLTRGRDD